MQLTSNAMPGQVKDGVVSILVGFLLDGLANDVERLACPHQSKDFIQCGFGGIEHFLIFGVGCAHHHRSACIAEIAVQFGRDVNIDQLAILDDMVTGNAMGNDRCNTDACAAGKVIHHPRRRLGAMFL